MENAEKYKFSHKKVERNCDKQFYPPPTEPSLPVCEHTGVFKEIGGNDCFRQGSYGPECFGLPQKPKYCT